MPLIGLYRPFFLFVFMLLELICQNFLPLLTICRKRQLFFFGCGWRFQSNYKNEYLKQ